MLGGATALAAVVVALGAVWQDRYKHWAQQRYEQGTRIRDGCLTVNGRLPTVAQVRDPLHLGVHPAPDASSNLVAAPRVPAYVLRDIDEQLRDLLSHGGFVLLVGDSTAGKSRTAYEAMTVALPRYILIAPHDREALPSALAKAAATKHCVLWLDDLEGYLGAGALTRNKITGLITGNGQCRVVLATLRAAEETRYTSDTMAPEAARQAHRDAREVLEQAHRVRLQRLFTIEEQKRAKTLESDPRIADAVAHADTYGIAEYLAAGPELVRDWENAWNPNTEPGVPTNPRGAALVTCAVEHSSRGLDGTSSCHAT